MLRRYLYFIVANLICRLRPTRTLVLIVAVVCTGALSHPSGDASTAKTDKNIALEKGATGTGSIVNQNEKHAYTIYLEAGHLLKLSAECRGGRVVLTAYDPQSMLVLAYDRRHKGPTPISLIAHTPGIYRVELSTQEKHPRIGYDLRVVENRPAVSRDFTKVAAERAFQEGSQLLGKDRPETRNNGLEKHNEALRLWRLAGDRREEAVALTAIGEAHELIGETKAAFTNYEHALAISRSVGDTRLAGEVLFNIGHLHYFLGDTGKALAACTEALRLSRIAQNPSGEARSLTGIGEAYYNLNKLPQALSHFQEALSLWRSLNERMGEAATLISLGYAYANLSEVSLALNSFESARSISEELEDERGKALALTALATLHAKLGNKQEAFEYHLVAREIFRTLGDRDSEATTLAGIGYFYFLMGDSRRALQHYDQVLLLFQAVGDKWGEAEARMDIGRMYSALGVSDKALTYLKDAHSLFRDLHIPLFEAQALREVGSVYDSIGDKQSALAYFKQTLAILRRGPNGRDEAYTFNSIGRTYESISEPRTALDHYQRALPLSRAAGDRLAEALTLYNTARAYRILGNLNAANNNIEAAIELIESVRTAVTDRDMRASYFASVHQYLELQIDVLMRLHKERPGEQFDVKAFGVSERARARSLVETLKQSHTDIREGVDPALAQRQQELRKLLNAKAERQTQLRGSGNVDEADAIAGEIDKLATEFDEVRARLTANSPRYAELTQPSAISLMEVQQKVLDDNSLLLEYSLGEERSYLWAVSRTEVSSYELAGRAEIEQAARRLYESLTVNQPVPGEDLEQRRKLAISANEQLPSQIEKLSRILIDPVADKLGTKRLLIIADGGLQYIPFQVLTKPANQTHGSSETRSTSVRARPLVEDHEIVNEPSASALAVLIGDAGRRKQPPNSVAVFADPVFELDDPRIIRSSPQSGLVRTQVSETEHRALRDVGLSGTGARIPRLPASRDEAAAIMASVPWRSGFKAMDFEASRSTAMRSDLGNYRIVHFATHGFLNDEHPELSGVVLSLFDEKGQTQEGFLRLHDIYNLKLPVDLVVLSACNTGLGKDVKGEGLIGLTRGFMYAGASSVVASLWKVDDEATAELMRHFYHGMLKDGRSPAAALRYAQLKMMNQKRWQSPYYWSGFIIQGQYVQRAQKYDYRFLYVILFCCSSIALGYIIFLVRRRRRTRVL
ncbi:MAG TPA: CHAT domain-containing tetratricopeptide repeat protein [Pyrinomonadaceae bacterium]|nr:CHAT domain-containing tetratricopeptide repeat protein [Pyrinomonadaceae bacterium]